MDILVDKPSVFELNMIVAEPAEAVELPLAKTAKAERRHVETAKDSIKSLMDICKDERNRAFEVVLGYAEDYNSQLSEFIDRVEAGASKRELSLRSSSVSRASDKFNNALKKGMTLK